jgi:maltooligosyltrehalose trehalohydrolase
MRYLTLDDTRLLIVNFGTELNLPSIATPLAAPPSGTRWRTLWSSESPRYGRPATPEVFTSAGMRVSGESAVLLWPHPIEKET